MVKEEESSVKNILPTRKYNRNYRVCLDRNPVSRNHKLASQDFAADSAQTKLKVTRDLPYAESADPRQKVDIYAPEGAKDLPVVFWIHGGGWQAGDRINIQVKPFAEDWSAIARAASSATASRQPATSPVRRAGRCPSRTQNSIPR